MNKTLLFFAISTIIIFNFSCKSEIDNDDFTVGSFTDERDGNVYKTIKIGNQVWMAENLRYLPKVFSNTSNSISSPMYYVYDYKGNNVDEAKITTNYLKFGVLYNWASAKTSCPNGWHLASVAEWNELINYLGGSEQALGKLKTSDEWLNDVNYSTNISGFNALPGGALDEDLKFSYLGKAGIWWSSTESNNFSAYHIDIFNSEKKIIIEQFNKSIGISIRCIKN